MPRLRRVSPTSAGWTRRRAGRGFTYVDASGERLGAADVERIKALVIPPAWEQVWICPLPQGHIQAVGTDAAGRRQYLYHPQWREHRDRAKFDRVALAPVACPLLVVASTPTSRCRRCRWSGSRRRRSGCSTSATSGSAATSTPRTTDRSG